MVLVDGKPLVARSRNTPPAARAAEVVKGHRPGRRRSLDVRITALRGYRYGIGRERDLSEGRGASVRPDHPGHAGAALRDESGQHRARLLPGRPAQPGETADKYVRADETLEAWLRDGVWAREESPAIYPYSQTYRVGGRR